MHDSLYGVNMVTVLFGPKLTEHLPELPPAEHPQFWNIKMENLPLLAEKHPWSMVELRDLDALEWVELAARGGCRFTEFEYQVIRAAALNRSTLVEDNKTPIQPTFGMIVTKSRDWCRAQLPSTETVASNPIGILYRVQMLSWEEM